MWPSSPDINYQNQKELFEHLKDIVVLYANSDSLLNKREKLMPLTNTRAEKPHIIAITEVKSQRKSDANTS